MKWVKYDEMFFLERNNGNRDASIARVSHYWRVTNYLDGSVYNGYTQEGAFAKAEATVRQWHEEMATALREPLPRPKPRVRIGTVTVVTYTRNPGTTHYIAVVDLAGLEPTCVMGATTAIAGKRAADMCGSKCVIDWTDAMSGVVYE